jgi:peroxiredoxin
MAITTSAPRVGQPLPAITLPALDGRAVHFSEFRKRHQRMLIFMWASW